MPEQMGGTDTCALRARMWTKTCTSPVIGQISRVPCSVFKLGTPRTRLLLTSSTPNRSLEFSLASREDEFTYS